MVSYTLGGVVSEMAVGLLVDRAAYYDDGHCYVGTQESGKHVDFFVDSWSDMARYFVEN